MIRRLVSILLIISLLPIPALRSELGSIADFVSESAESSELSKAMSDQGSASNEMPGITVPGDREFPDDVQPICIAETEISEYEGSEGCESGSVDLSCAFERLSDTTSRIRFLENVAGSGSFRFMNPNEIFRTLRC